MSIINWHIAKYPLIQEQDIHKLIYQMSYGNAHMITDIDKVKANLQNEINYLDNSYQDLYEYVGDYVRMNLRPYLKFYFSLGYLLNSFVLSANNITPNDELYNSLLSKYNIPRLENLSHSLVYKENYKPNYRLIKKEFITSEMKYIQAYNFILNNQDTSIIALEGKCGSGKTYLSQRLSKHLDIEILPIDYFFLPTNRKTKKRLSEVGGNIDYELVRETLLDIRNNKPRSIKIFDCKKQEYYKIPFNPKKIVILEGVYSFHPYFRDLIDKMIYIDTPFNIRNDRLKERDNYQDYINKWIPLEDKYFDELDIIYTADLII